MSDSDQLIDSDVDQDRHEDGLHEQGSEDDDDDLALHVFRQHKQAVLTVNLSCSGSWAVTGSQDDMAYVWETRTGQLLFSCEGHKDSVHCAAFSCKETFVCTADMAGLVQVFNLKSREKTFQFEVDDLHWILWHSLSDSTLIVGTESGSIWLLNVSDEQKVKTLSGSSATTAGKLTSCGTKLLAGYQDGTLRLWDLKNSSSIFTVKGRHCRCCSRAKPLLSACFRGCSTRLLRDLHRFSEEPRPGNRGDGIYRWFR